MYEYVSKSKYQDTKNKLIELIKLVQDEVRDYFTFRFDFIGSASRNMITMDTSGNKGYDFDVNIQVNDDEENYAPQEIRKILKNAFDKHARLYDYDYAEDSKRVLTIKVKDIENSRIMHSCDFAVVYNCLDGRQQFIYYNKFQNTYEWQDQPEPFYELKEKEKELKAEKLWQEVREEYLKNKNNNRNSHKKSRSIYAETINNIYNKYLN